MGAFLSGRVLMTDGRVLAHRRRRPVKYRTDEGVRR